MKKLRIIIFAVGTLFLFLGCSDEASKIKLKSPALQLADGTPISQAATDEYNPQVVQMPDGFLVLAFGSDRSCGTCTANTHNVFVTRSVSAYNNDAKLPAFNTPTVASPTINLANAVTFTVTKSGSNLRLYYNNAAGNIVSLDVTTSGANVAGPTAITNATWQATKLVGIDAAGTKVFAKNAAGLYLFDPTANNPTLTSMATAISSDSVMHVNASFSGISDAYLTLTGGKVTAASYTAAGGDVVSLNTVFATAKVSVKSLNALQTGVKRGEFIFLSATEAGAGKQDLYVLDGTTPGSTWDNLATKPPLTASGTVTPADFVSTTATRVYGQTDFVSAVTLLVSPTRFYNTVIGISLDATGLYVADQNNQRAVFFPGTSTTATRVYGQANDLNCRVTHNTGVGCTAGTLNPNGNTGFDGNIPAVHADANGVYITGINDVRVLFYSGVSTTPSRVYGQATYTTNASGTSATALTNPTGIGSDASGFYIADNGNHRVVYYAGVSTTGSRFYGQFGNANCGQSNNNGSCGAGTASANSLNGPRGVHADANGVYIADTANNRVLFYSGTSTTATRVYGQDNSFTTTTAGTTATKLNNPWFVTTIGDKVYISDNANHRVLGFSGTSTTATFVIGQSGSFTTGVSNQGSLATNGANCLSAPKGLAADSTGLYVADQGNNRVLFFAK